jgi:hypothetical protein
VWVTDLRRPPVNNKYRFVLVAIALVVLGTAAVASGATGDPLILGAINEAGKGTNLSSDTQLGEPTLTVTASGTQIPFAAVAGDETEFAAYVRGYEDALKLDGAVETDRAGVVVIPAGQTRITFVPRTGPESDSENPVQADTLMLATVQGNVATSVLNVTLRPDLDTATIRLTRAANVGVRVGWFTLRSYPPS